MKRKKILKGGLIVMPDQVIKGSLVIEDEIISGIVMSDLSDDYELIDVSGKILLPGLVDPHVHMWEPSPQDYREDWQHGSRCAASGGITTIIDMPLSTPPVTDQAGFDLKCQAAGQKSCVDFALWGGLIPSCVDKLRLLNELGCTAYKGFMSYASPDYPQITDGWMVKAMRTAASFGGLIGVHAENAEIADFGCKAMDEARCTDESMYDLARPWWVELEAIQRAVLFAKANECRLYVCHVSTAEGAELIKKAKGERLPIALETCPHYLIFDNTVLREKKTYAKCNPPFRSRDNVEKMWDYIFDGTIDTIGSDHGPYTDEEKIQEGSFWRAPSGFGGFDAMLPALWTEGVNRRGLSLSRLAELTSSNAAKLMGLFPRKGSLLPGSDADVAVLDPSATWYYDGTKSFSKTKSAHGIYQGMQLDGKIAMTIVRGEIVYDGSSILAQPGYGRYIPRHKKE